MEITAYMYPEGFKNISVSRFYVLTILKDSQSNRLSFSELTKYLNLVLLQTKLGNSKEYQE